MKIMIKAILFDWSGVLSDDMKTTYLTAIDVLKIRGINEPMDINRFKDLYELPWNRVYEKMGYNVDLSEENILWSREMPKHLHHTKLYPFTKKLLQDLKKEKIKVLIISSREENSIKQEIEQNKIGHLVDRIYSTPGSIFQLRKARSNTSIKNY